MEKKKTEEAICTEANDNHFKLMFCVELNFCSLFFLTCVTN